MNREDLLRELAETEERYIEEAAEEKQTVEGSPAVARSGRKSRRKSRRFHYGGAVAAVIAAVVVIGVLPALRERPQASAVAEYSVTGEAMAEAASEGTENADAAAPEGAEAAGGAAFDAAEREAVGSTGNTEDTESAGMEKSAVRAVPEALPAIENPWTEVATIEEAEALAGFTLAIPEELASEYPQHRISVIAEDCIELCFSDTDGAECLCIRKGRGTEDVSGDYTAYSTVRERDAGEQRVTVKGEGERIFTAVWTSGDYAFALFSEHAALTEEEILKLVSRIL